MRGTAACWPATMSFVDRSAIVARYRLAEVKGDAVVGLPSERVQHNLGDRLFAREHGRKQDAVVVRMRFFRRDRGRSSATLPRYGCPPYRSRSVRTSSSSQCYLHPPISQDASNS